MYYTLDDLYKIFQQEESREEKVELLRAWSRMYTGLNINWKALIRVWS